MIDLEKTASHRVYHTELLGYTLVVTLQGDAAGFSIGAVHNEMVTLVGLSRKPEISHLVIDLSGSNYYGSLVLGEIVNLAQVVREKGGRVALAGTSPDMKEVLRMMRLDAMWERYPTRSMALRALATIPWQQRIRPWLKPLAIGGTVVLLLALYLYLPRPDHTREHYLTVIRIWEEARKLQASQGNDTEWLILMGKAEKKFGELSIPLERSGKSGNEPARNLMYVTRDYGLKALEHRLAPHDFDTIQATYYLDMTRALLEHKPLPVPPEIVTSGSPPQTITTPPATPTQNPPPVKP